MPWICSKIHGNRNILASFSWFLEMHWTWMSPKFPLSHILSVHLQLHEEFKRIYPQKRITHTHFTIVKYMEERASFINLWITSTHNLFKFLRIFTRKNNLQPIKSQFKRKAQLLKMQLNVRLVRWNQLRWIWPNPAINANTKSHKNYVITI